MIINKFIKEKLEKEFPFINKVFGWNMAEELTIKKIELPLKLDSLLDGYGGGHYTRYYYVDCDNIIVDDAMAWQHYHNEELFDLVEKTEKYLYLVVVKYNEIFQDWQNPDVYGVKITIYK